MWRCEKKDSGGKKILVDGIERGGRKGYCNGRIWTRNIDNAFHSVRRKHSYSDVGNPTRVEIQKVLTNVRKRAASTMEKPSQIRVEVTQNITLAARGQLPSTKNMRQKTNVIR